MSAVDLTLERFAEMQADLAAGEALRDVLGRASVDEAAWTEAKDKWLDAMGREARRGRSALSARYARVFLLRRPELARGPDEDAQAAPVAVAARPSSPTPAGAPLPPAPRAPASTSQELPSFLRAAATSGAVPPDSSVTAMAMAATPVAPSPPAAPAGAQMPGLPVAQGIAGSTAFGVAMPIPARELPFPRGAAPPPTRGGTAQGNTMAPVIGTELPFRKGSANPTPPDLPPAHGLRLATEVKGSTAEGVIMPIPGRALPFPASPSAPGAPAAPRPPEKAPTELSGSTSFGVVMPIPGRDLPFQHDANKPSGALAALAALPRGSVQQPGAPARPSPQPSTAPSPRPAAPAAPTGGTAMAFELPANLRATPFDKPAPSAQSSGPPPRPPGSAPAPPPSEGGELSVERYAALGVELSVTHGAQVEAVLRREGMTRDLWERVNREYGARLQRDPALRAAFERALAVERARRGS